VTQQIVLAICSFALALLGTLLLTGRGAIGFLQQIVPLRN
jgi:hypothetical protein